MCPRRKLSIVRWKLPCLGLDTAGNTLVPCWQYSRLPERVLPVIWELAEAFGRPQSYELPAESTLHHMREVKFHTHALDEATQVVFWSSKFVDR